MLRLALAVACASALGVPLTGCKDTDALKEIIYDQASENIDFDNPNKIYLSDETAEATSDKIPSSEVSEEGVVTIERQNLMVYSSDPNTQGYVAKQSLWSPEPDFEGIEASSGVHFVRSDDPDAPEQPLPEEKEEEEEPEEEPEDEPMQAEGGNEASSEVAGDAIAPDAVETTTNQTQGGAGNGGEEKAPEADADNGDAQGDKTAEGAGEAEPTPAPPQTLPVTDGNVNFDTTDPTEDPLPASAIAAYGDAAVLVEMIGGKGALAAADATLLKSDFPSVVDGGISVATGWSGDGTEKNSIKVDAIIKSGADTVLVYSGSEMSKADREKLNAANVAVQQIYPNTNTSNIKRNAQTIGAILAESDAVETDSVAMAEAYIAFMDATVDDVCAKANGSSSAVAGSSVFEKGNNAYDGTGDGKYTLVMDDYNANALYNKTFGDWKPVSNGALLATMGTETSATSFYVQAGGLINTAAIKGATSGKIIAWQFNTNVMKLSKSLWSGLEKDTVFPSVSGYEGVLFTASRSSSGNSEASGNFGSDSFPRVIVGSQKAASFFVKNSKNAKGIYHPFGLSTLDTGGVFFGVLAGGNMILSTIGVDSAANPDGNVFGDDGVPESAVAVCPTGLFSSWIRGTAPESFLMAAWVNDEVNEDSGEVNWKAKVKEFYSQFYRCDLSDGQLSAIEQGAEK